MKKVLLTGATGFVAKALIPLLQQHNKALRLTTRSATSLGQLQQDHPTLLPDDILVTGDLIDWEQRLSSAQLFADVDTVIHLAARVHVMDEVALDPEQAFYLANVQVTQSLARAAAKQGVRRFIYISSIKVNGEFTLPGQVFRADDVPNPSDAYAKSKWQAELVLKQLARETALDIVIFRPPLIFGPGVKANFQKLMHWIQRGIPLPLGRIDNERSLLYVENFAHILYAAIDATAVAGKTYTVADQPALSTPQLITELATAMQRKPRLLSVPLWSLHLLGRLLGQQSTINRLTQSLLIDATQLHRDLNQKSPYQIAQALSKTTKAH